MSRISSAADTALTVTPIDGGQPVQDADDLRGVKEFAGRKKGTPIYRVKLQTYEEASLLIDEYIHFYNNQRLQLKTKLTPLEKRYQFVA